MKLWILCCFCFAGLWAQAEKKFVPSPFQTNVRDCLGSKVDVKKIDTNKKLYDVISGLYPLASFETLFREVLYTMKGEQKKLKFEDGIIQIFNVIDEDDSLKLVSSEKFSDKLDYQARHKLKSAEARMNQLLFRADIKSDFQKVKETRAKQVELNIVFSDSQIKSLIVDLPFEKKVLSCQQIDQTDICNCRL